MSALVLAEGKPAAKNSKSLSLTFDYFPVDQPFGEVDHRQVVEQLIEALDKHDAKAIGFAVGEKIGADFDLLGQWLNKGHALGSMTYSHQDLHEIGPDLFISDIVSGENALDVMLDGFGQKKRYFRYPYLHYGEGVHTKRAVQDFLQNHKIKVVHATILVEDFLYNMSLEKLGSDPDSAAIDQIGSEYLKHVMEKVAEAENLSMKVLHRQCRHILQLRANQLNALVLDDLLTALEEVGYQFVTIDKALADDLYSAPEAYFGSRGVSYIQMIKESNLDLMPAR
jgi:peptidoglycan/xylan/chitin deacetylase (PgdA/CDA1 family)